MGGSWGAFGWILGGLWVRTKTETQNSSHQLPCSHFGSSPGAPWWTYCGITRGITRREPGTSLTYTSGSALTLLLVDRLTATSSSITLQSPEGTWSSRFLATLDSGCWICARLTERGSGPVMGGGNGCRGMALLRGGGGVCQTRLHAPHPARIASLWALGLSLCIWYIFDGLQFLPVYQRVDKTSKR